MMNAHPSAWAFTRPRLQPAPCRGCSRQRRPSLLVVRASSSAWRPTPDDVERLSRGDGAKVRGTGSRFIPHRLNAEERALYDQAKKKGFLSVRGTGYRKERKGYPLPNIWRQWCDARGLPCVVVEQGAGATPGGDILVVDLATLRSKALPQVSQHLVDAAAALGAAPLGAEQSALVALPFNVILQGCEESFTVEELGASQGEDELGSVPDADECSTSAPAAGGGSPATAPRGPLSDEERQDMVAGLLDAISAQALAVRHLKEVEKLTKNDSTVKLGVQNLLRLKEELRVVQEGGSPAAAAAVPPASGQAAVEGPAEAGAWREGRVVVTPFVPTWRLPVEGLFFAADRSAAKQLAKCVMEAAAALSSA